MKTIPEENIDKQLGKAGFWLPANIAGKLSYLYGIDAFDTIKAETPSDLPNPFNLKILPEGIELSMMHKFKMRRVGLPLRDITAIELKLPEEIITQKERSVLGRAVVFGLLLGPVGALVGGMSGLRPGQEVEHVDGLLTISANQGGVESFLVASVKKGQDLQMVQQFLKKHLSQFYQQ